MLMFAIRRILLMVPLFLVMVFVVLLIMEFIPGDPGTILLGQYATPEAIDAVNRELGYYDPFFVKYFNYVSDFVRGDMGYSYRTRLPVFDEIVDRMPVSLKICLISTIISVIIGIPLGILSAVKQYSIMDISGTVFALILASVPAFWLGLMLIMVFSLILGWMPALGSNTVKGLIMPSFAVAASAIAANLRLTRTAMLETIRADYITTARSKGQKESKVIMKHALKNALLPVITIVGINFGHLMGNTIITEQVFSVNGLGTMIITAIRSKDVPVVIGGTLTMVFFYMLVMLVIDLLYAFIDPRIKARYSGGRG